MGGIIVAPEVKDYGLQQRITSCSLVSFLWDIGMRSLITIFTVYLYEIMGDSTKKSLCQN